MTASVNQPPELKKSKPTPPPPKRAAQKLGQRGESLAAAFLQKRHHRILARNVRSHTPWGKAEADLIALDTKHQTLVCVEVKTRSSSRYGYPDEGLSNRQLAALHRALTTYQSTHHLWHLTSRIDLISILTGKNGKIKWFRDITWE